MWQKFKRYQETGIHVLPVLYFDTQLSFRCLFCYKRNSFDILTTKCKVQKISMTQRIAILGIVEKTEKNLN